MTTVWIHALEDRVYECQATHPGRTFATKCEVPQETLERWERVTTEWLQVQSEMSSAASAVQLEEVTRALEKWKRGKA